MGVGITFKWLKLYINMEMYYKYKIYLFFFCNFSTDRRTRDNKNIFVANIFQEGKKFQRRLLVFKKRTIFEKKLKKPKTKNPKTRKRRVGSIGQRGRRWVNFEAKSSTELKTLKGKFDKIERRQKCRKWWWSKLSTWRMELVNGDIRVS